MPDLAAISSHFLGDPVLGYSTLAALFLCVVAVTAGLARGDAVALANPRATLACAACVVAAVALQNLMLEGVAGGNDFATRFQGAERFPLVVAALAYGPTPALLSAALFSAFTVDNGLLSPDEALLALELVMVGWLAIYPSPRQHLWAGPFNAVLAYGLAWTSGGVALAQWHAGDLAADNFLVRNPGSWAGVLLAAAALFTLSPGAYGLLFPASRIAPAADDGYGTVVIEPMRATRRERRRTLEAPAAPTSLPPRQRRRFRSGSE